MAAGTHTTPNARSSTKKTLVNCQHLDLELMVDLVADQLKPLITAPAISM